MAKFQINFAKYIPKQEREIVKLSPKQKFDRIVRRLSVKDKKSHLRRFHFNVIENGNEIVIFDGEGNEIMKTNNCIEGCIEARQKCLSIFLSSNDKNGGFKFTALSLIDNETSEWKDD